MPSPPGAVHLSMRYLHTLIGEIAVAMAGRVSAGLVGDTQPPYPTLSELVRWTTDQAPGMWKTRKPYVSDTELL
jgi:hypothetical protein